jgi:hypothetical protein
MPDQPQWHFCKKCGVMHYAPAKGPCVVNGQHEAQGFNFNLPYDNPEVANTQAFWRYCNVCHGLFYNGPDGKVVGRCINGRGHTNSGSFNFVLRHSLPEAPGMQGKWFYCRNCGLMNYGPFIGHCIVEKDPGGGVIGHDDTQSFDFTLPHTAEFIP